ncbi:hypothetical protein KCP78_01175 [Salmonella enterica subsp. enterica]|nr:hypothetical protein KCP78_01175 [Salmonella enterica subsp. enterica]
MAVGAAASDNCSASAYPACPSVRQSVATPGGGEAAGGHDEVFTIRLPTGCRR